MLLPDKAGYIVNRTGTGVAHAWTGRDTACRMYSTGGLKRSKYDYAISPGDRPMCANCIDKLGHDPTEGMPKAAVRRHYMAFTDGEWDLLLQAVKLIKDRMRSS